MTVDRGERAVAVGGGGRDLTAVTPTVLLDASVWLAALDQEDRHHEPSRTVIRSLPVHTLDLALYETSNVATRSWSAGEQARGVVALILGASGDRLARATPSLMTDAIGVAEQFSITVYDAAYVALSRHLGATLVSCDERDLVNQGLAVLPEDVVAQM